MGSKSKSKRGGRKQQAGQEMPAVVEKREMYNLHEMPSDESGDEWEKDRDVIALEEEEESLAWRRNGSRNAYGDLEEREVLGLVGAEDDSEAEEEEEEDAAEHDDDDGSELEEEELLENFKKYNRYKEPLAGGSDEEEEEEEEKKKNATGKGKGSKGGEEEEGGWGRKREGYYVSDDDEYSDEEQAKEEEKEALRLQKLQMESFRDTDFMDESFEGLLKKSSPKFRKLPKEDEEEEEEEDEDLETEQVVKANISNMTEKEQDRLLKSNWSEIIPLIEDFEDVTELVQDEDDLHPKTLLLANLYLSNLSFYFALCVGAGKDDFPISKRLDHPIGRKLKILRGLLNQLLQMPQNENDMAPEESEEDGLMESQEESDEVDELASEEAQNFEEEEDETEGTDDIAFEEYEPIIMKKKKSHSQIDAFGETGIINDVDFREKQEKSKGLQFHVNRVDQSIINRDAVKQSLRGDSDLPYKEGKGRILAGKSSKVEEDSEEEREEANDLNGEVSEEDDNEYYNQIKNEKKRKIQEREEFHQQLHTPMEGEDELFTEENLGPDSKRKATYKILANRGLTPHRKKENRNPRVKRRMKYDQALKKLSSTRSVAADKSKLSARYQGERTGIKANLAKSVKFG